MGAVTSMYRICMLLVNKLNCAKCRIPENRLPILKHQPRVISIILTFILIGVCVVWFVFRNER